MTWRAHILNEGGASWWGPPSRWVSDKVAKRGSIDVTDVTVRNKVTQISVAHIKSEPKNIILGALESL